MLLIKELIYILSSFCYVDKHYWTHGYVLISKEVEDCVPVFLKHIANDVYICGKTINLLKSCCPRVSFGLIPSYYMEKIMSLEQESRFLASSLLYQNLVLQVGKAITCSQILVS